MGETSRVEVEQDNHVTSMNLLTLVKNEFEGYPTSKMGYLSVISLHHLKGART